MEELAEDLDKEDKTPKQTPKHKKGAWREASTDKIDSQLSAWLQSVPVAI